MYESFFGFVKRPFLAVSTLDRYFPGTSIEQAFQTASRAIQRGEGPVAIFGGSGLGKTMCCLRIAENFRRNFEVIMLASSQLITRRALLQSLLFELRMPYREMSEGELRLTLMNRLQPSTENPTDGLVLIVDEAQTLSTKLLEELRLLTNVVRNGVPRVRMILCGTMRLEESLSHPHMDSLNQRLAARCYLTPLSIQETGNYVRHKIELSGVESSSIITREALDAIYRGSDGIPRLIDQLADQSLMLACNDRECPVSAAMVGRAWCMLQQLPNPWSEPETIASTDSKKSSMTALSATKPSQPAISPVAPIVPVAPVAIQTGIEYGQLDDEFENEETYAPEVPSRGATQGTMKASFSETRPNLVDEPAYGTNEELRLAPETNVQSTPRRSKNLLDVFSGDFDEEFSIPLQSSDSYQAYSGAAYGNLNHDLSSFGTTPTTSKLRVPQFEIEEANEFLSNPFLPNSNVKHPAPIAASNESNATTAINVPAPIDQMPLDFGVHQYDSMQEFDMEPVSNISPEQAANLERQIEEEMRDLVSGLNMNAMSFDSASNIEMVHYGASEPNGFRHPESMPEAQHLSHRANSDVLAFSSLHVHSQQNEPSQMHGFSGAPERAAMSDDRDLLIIEDQLDAVRDGAQQAVVGSSRAVMHPYAKLFTKLRNS